MTDPKIVLSDVRCQNINLRSDHVKSQIIFALKIEGLIAGRR
jgi:hypothetical protein